MEPIMEEEEISHDGEGPDGIHPKTLTQHTPATIINIFSFVIQVVSLYGWFILFGSILCYYIWKNLHPKYEKWKEAAEHHKNPDKFIERETAISAARQRMQEKYDELAKERAQKLDENEETLQDAPRVAARLAEDNRHDSKSTCSQRKPNKSGNSSLRPAYNPLMGDTSSCAWRPGGGRRSGGG